jgi:Tfp pilus assembly protein PilN
MQVINFVPQDYIKRKRARKANMLCGMLAAVVVVALGIALMLTGATGDEIEQMQSTAQSRLSEAAADVARWKKMQSDRQALLERAERSAELMNPLPHSRIVAEVVSALPSSSALTELHVLDQKVRVIEAAAPPAGAAGRRGRQPAQVVRERVETRLRVIGIAPTDVEVARVMAGLSGSALFEKVELAYSEDQVVSGRAVRKFEVSMQLRGNAAMLARQAVTKGETL